MKYSDGITTREESYWFGFIIGDGSLSRGRNRLNITLQPGDRGHLVKLQSFFGGGRIVPVLRKYHAYIIENKRLANNLRAIGLTPNKTFTITKDIIPDVYTMDFLRGLLDADGSIYVDFPTVLLRWNGTESMMYGIREYLSGHMKRLPKVWNDRTTYCFGVGGRHKVEKLASLLWNQPPVYLDRKYETVQSLINFNKTHPRVRNRLSEEDIARIFHYKHMGIQQTSISRIFSVDDSYISKLLRKHYYCQKWDDTFLDHVSSTRGGTDNG